MGATAICEERVHVVRERRPCAGPRGITLGQLLTRAHEDAAQRRTADCPVCGGVMEHAEAEAVCTGCGSGLS